MSDLGYLLPGVFPIPLGWDDVAVRRAAADKAIAAMPSSATKPPFPARLIIAQLVDYYTSIRQREADPCLETTTPEGFICRYTRPEPESLTALPLPDYVLVALAASLPMTAKQRQQIHADEARRLRGTMSVADIGKRLGRTREHVQRVLFKTEGVPARNWQCPDDVVADIQDAADRRLVYEAARWFADRGEPLPYAIWWAVVCALDLGHGKMPVLVRRRTPMPLTTDEERQEATSDYIALGWSPEIVDREIASLGPTASEAQQECAALGLTRTETLSAMKGLDVIRGGVAAYGLTDATIISISHGVKKPEGFDAAAKKVGQSRARHDRRHGFTGCAPLSVSTVATALAEATVDADRRRGTAPVMQIAGQSDRSDTVASWMAHPDWERAVASHEILARWNPKRDPRAQAVRLVAEARAKLPAAGYFIGVPADDQMVRVIAEKIGADMAHGHRPEAAFTGVEPFTIDGLSGSMDVSERSLERRLTDALEWDIICLIEEAKVRSNSLELFDTSECDIF